MRHFESHPRPTDSETLQVEPNSLSFNKPSRGFWGKLNFENCLSRNQNVTFKRTSGVIQFSVNSYNLWIIALREREKADFLVPSKLEQSLKQRGS